MKVQLKPAVQPITCVAEVRYKSSNGKAVKVSGKGYVTAKKKGKSTITVQFHRVLKQGGIYDRLEDRS